MSDRYVTLEIYVGRVHPCVGLGWVGSIEVKFQKFVVYNVTVKDIRSRMSANKVEAVELVRWECQPQWDEDPQVTEESLLITLCSFQFHVAYSCEF